MALELLFIRMFDENFDTESTCVVHTTWYYTCTHTFSDGQ